MKRIASAEKSTSRRSFLKNGIVSAGAATLSATVMAKELSALERPEEGPEITEGDVAILQFLAAAELIERDLWQQYNELGGVDAAQSGYVEIDEGIGKARRARSRRPSGRTFSRR